MTVTTVADHPFPADLVEVWDRGQEQWAALSSQSVLVPVQDTGHRPPSGLAVHSRGRGARSRTKAGVMTNHQDERCGDSALEPGTGVA